MFDLRDERVIDLNSAEVLLQNVVYKYQDIMTKKNLVAKIIGPSGDPINPRLVNEFRKMANLSAEPEICSVYFLATAQLNGEKFTCFIEDFIDGPSLADLLSDGSDLDYEQSIRILIELARGLEKAHSYEIFHNDLHDKNILFDQFGYLKIIDFLWTDSSIPNSEKGQSDIQHFQSIVNDLYEKCPNEEKIRFIREACSNITSFKGLSNIIESINEVSFELSRFDNHHQKIISTLLHQLPKDYSFTQSFTQQRVELPPSIAALGEKGTYVDAKIFGIQNYVEEKFFYALQPLKIAELIDYNIGIENVGEDNKDHMC